MKWQTPIITTLILAGSIPVQATNVFEMEGYGAISRAMGGTASAYATGNAALMTNPANLLLLPDGDHLELGLDMVSTDMSVKNSRGERANGHSVANNRGPYFAPQLSYIRKNGQWAFGAGVYAGGGLGTEYGDSSFLSRIENGRPADFENASRLLVLRAPIAMSYQPNPDLSVGAAVDMVWTALNLELLLGSSQVGALAAGGHLSGDLVGPLAGFAGTEGGAHFSLTKNHPVGGAVDAFGLGGRMGFHYRLNPSTTIGASYNFETAVGDLTGKATLTAISGDLGQLPLYGDIRFKNFEMPAGVSIGVAHQFNSKWLLTADYKRVFWSDVMENIDVSFSSANGNIDIELPHDYRDINIFSIGTAYQWSPQLILRAGFSYAEQALRDHLILTVIPAYLKKHFTLGGEYQFNANSSLNLALSYAPKESLNTPTYLSATDNLRQSHRQVNAVLSYRYRF